MDIFAYLRALRRWAWLIGLVVITCGATSFLVSIQLPKTYQVTSVGLVSPKQLIPPSGTVGDAAPQVPSLDQLVETYVGLVNTEPVRRRIVDGGIPRSPDQLKGNIQPARQTNTTLINILISDEDPAIAQSIARDIIPAFNASLDDLQGKVGGDVKNHLESLVPWELPAKAPSQPVAPNIPRNVLIAAAGGLVLAIILAFLLERLDDTIKREADIHSRLEIPTLGSIEFRRAVKGSSDGEAVELISATNLIDPIAEQFRAIRTNLMFSHLGEPLRTLVVTSTQPGEGKTTTACNLAVVFAQAGSRVILVDADFRRPAVHRVFNRRQNLGLGGLLLRAGGLSDMAYTTPIQNLSVVCSGPPPPNPSELLGSTAMEKLLESFARVADVVIFDTPPVGAVTDATVLGAMADGVVLVVERGAVRIQAIAKGIETLESVGASVLGALLNKSRARDAYYYYHGEPPIALAPGIAETKETSPGGASADAAGAAQKHAGG
jgi:capsular exopolysaccharide synthesis family protein